MSNHKKEINPFLFEIAGVVVEMSSSFQLDLDIMLKYLKHHIVEQNDAIVPHHKLKTINTMHMELPDDAQHKWTLGYHGMMRFGARNFIERFARKLTYRYNDEAAVCYHSDTTGCDYIRISKGQFWIINDNTNNETICHIIETHNSLIHKKRKPSISAAAPLLLHLILAAHKRYVMHSSAVKCSNGAHVFLGVSGSGKSTLCTDLAQNCGAEFMGDDLICIYEQGGTIMAGALLLDVKLFEENKSCKNIIDLIDDRGVKFCHSAPVASFCRVNQTRTGASTLEPLDDEMKLHQLLMSSNNAAMQPDKEHWMNVIINACTTVPMFTFNFGDRNLLDKKILEEI